MSFHPLFRPRSIARDPQWWTFCHRSNNSPLAQTPFFSFHDTARQWSASTPNHYETLQLAPNASRADIKRQFYLLSKIHHPDRNPDDPAASTRFVAISEAYHILYLPEKRAEYDNHLQKTNYCSSSGGDARGTDIYPKGSFSSASFGARPANGLSKKRSTFRGPPPSFYKAGGYGQQGSKRAKYGPQSSYAQTPEEPNDYTERAGFRPGQEQGSYVFHFDDRQHRKMHDSVNEHIARKKRVPGVADSSSNHGNPDMLTNFFIVSGIIGFIGVVTIGFGNHQNVKRNDKRKEESRV